MNKTEICESILEEADGRAVQLPSLDLGRDVGGDLYVTEPTHRNVIRWVDEEYERIQYLSSHWEFHHMREKFLDVVATTDIYTHTDIREAKEHYFYFIKSGETARYPLEVQSYEWWLAREQTTNASTSSVPNTLINAPDEQWILWPTPSVNGEVHGVWWEKPSSFADADASPIWATHYHALIKWGVLEMYASEFAGEGTDKKLLARAARMHPPMWAAFRQDYLPNIANPHTFL